MFKTFDICIQDGAWSKGEKRGELGTKCLRWCCGGGIAKVFLVPAPTPKKVDNVEQLYGFVFV